MASAGKLRLELGGFRDGFMIGRSRGSIAVRRFMRALAGDFAAVTLIRAAVLGLADLGFPGLTLPSREGSFRGRLGGVADLDVVAVLPDLVLVAGLEHDLAGV